MDELRKNDYIPAELKHKFDNIQITNLERVLEDPDIRGKLNIDFNDGKYTLTGRNCHLNNFIHDLCERKINVNDIKSKEDRAKYIDALLKRPPEQSSTPAPGPKTNSKTYNLTDRKTLIKKRYHKLTITDPRVSRIYRELSSVSVISYPNAVAVLFRVFVEFSVDLYIKKHHISLSKTQLCSKIKRVADFMQEGKILNEHQLKRIRCMAEEETKNGVCSTNTFNAYVHNSDFQPFSSDLIKAFDDIFPFLQELCKDI